MVIGKNQPHNILIYPYDKERAYLVNMESSLKAPKPATQAATKDQAGNVNKGLWIAVGVLSLVLVIAFYFLGSLTVGGSSCNKTCDTNKKPSCPIGYANRCDSCTGHYYCGEAQCGTSADCKTSGTLANKESRSTCVKKTGADKGYCYQCDVDSDCTKITNNSSLKCQANGWCSLCTDDSQCTTEFYDAKESGTCTNNVCVFGPNITCNTGDFILPGDAGLAPIWPYTTKAYADFQSCPLKKS